MLSPVGPRRQCRSQYFLPSHAFCNTGPSVNAVTSEACAPAGLNHRWHREPRHAITSIYRSLPGARPRWRPRAAPQSDPCSANRERPVQLHAAAAAAAEGRWWYRAAARGQGRAAQPGAARRPPGSLRGLAVGRLPGRRRGRVAAGGAGGLLGALGLRLRERRAGAAGAGVTWACGPGLRGSERDPRPRGHSGQGEERQPSRTFARACPLRPPPDRLWPCAFCIERT
jgi:hypothetical protein